MKIVILSPSRQTGGVERFCFYLERVLGAAGHDVRVLAAEDVRGAKHIWAAIGLGVPYVGCKLGKLAEREGYDVLVTNGAFGWNVKRGRIINVQHGTFAAAADKIDRSVNFPKWLMKKYVWGYFEKLAARHGVMVAVSEETRLNCVKYYGVKSKKVIPNGIDLDFFKRRDGAESRKLFGLPTQGKIALFVGRFEYGKGSDILDALLPFFKKRDITLLVASPAAIQKEGIIFLKDVSYEKSPYLYSAADFFVMPSRQEGDSFAFTEAMACELPFVVSAFGGTSIVRGNPILSPFVIPEIRTGAFESAIERLLQLSEEQLTLLRKEERTFDENYHNVVKMGKEYLTLLHEEH